MPLDRADVESALLAKGFTYKSGDHRFYFFEHEGQTTAIFTKVSHGSGYKTIDDKLVGKMARQLKLTTGQFKKLVSCKMGKKQYVAALRSRGIIRP